MNTLTIRDMTEDKQKYFDCKNEIIKKMRSWYNFKQYRNIGDYRYSDDEKDYVEDNFSYDDDGQIDLWCDCGSGDPTNAGNDLSELVEKCYLLSSTAIFAIFKYLSPATADEDLRPLDEFDADCKGSKMTQAIESLKCNAAYLFQREIELILEHETDTDDLSYVRK